MVGGDAKDVVLAINAKLRSLQQNVGYVMLLARSRHGDADELTLEAGNVQEDLQRVQVLVQLLLGDNHEPTMPSDSSKD